MKPEITFVRLPEIDPGEILAHMSDPRMAEHLPLMNFEWTVGAVSWFVGMKEDCWQRDGLGHWAILSDGEYVGWGGFQKEGDEWDYGLVLRPDAFGLGARISRKAISLAKTDERIPFVTFLLPLSRTKLRALEKMGARRIGVIDHDGTSFIKFRLETL